MDKEEEGSKDEIKKFLNQIGGHEVIQIKNNFIPKGMVLMEQIFNHNDVPTKSGFWPVDENVEEHNLNTKENPQKVKLAKSLKLACKNSYFDLNKKFKYFFRME